MAEQHVECQRHGQAGQHGGRDIDPALRIAFRDRAGVELVLRMNPATGRVRIIEMAAQ